MQKESVYGNSIFVIRNFLTAEECEGFIADGEERGFEDAPLNATFGTQMRKDVRDNTRVIFDAPALAASLYERAALFLPARSGKWGLTGFNERFRYYRYDVGQRFKRHYDGSYERPNGEESIYTFLIYLNDGYEGGCTDFFDREDTLRARVTPERGTALVFEHQQVHEGATVFSGRKYVLRTDVMYAYKK